MLKRFLRDDSGSAILEYALIAAATCLALVAVVPSFKSKLSATLANL